MVEPTLTLKVTLLSGCTFTLRNDSVICVRCSDVTFTLVELDDEVVLPVVLEVLPVVLVLAPPVVLDALPVLLVLPLVLSDAVPDVVPCWAPLDAVPDFVPCCVPPEVPD